MWTTIKCLQNNNNNNPDNQALQTDTGTHISNRSKTNAFRADYQKVTKLKKNKNDRFAKRNLHKILRTPTCDEEPSKDINRTEITNAINKANVNKTPGPDKIHQKFIAHLGSKAISYVSDLFNQI